MGAVIYRPTDRIEIKFESFSVWVSPLNSEQRGAIQQLYQTISGVDKTNAGKVALETLRYTVKEISNVFFSDDEPFKLQFGPDELLTKECAEALMYMQSSESVVAVGGRVGLGTYFYDDIPGAGEKFKVILDKQKSVEKKNGLLAQPSKQS